MKAEHGPETTYIYRSRRRRAASVGMLGVLVERAFALRHAVTIVEAGRGVLDQLKAEGS